MKTLYPNPHAVHSLRSGYHKHFSLFLLLAVFSLSGFATGTPTLNFKTYSLVGGTAGADGAVYLFRNLDSKTDALVKITKRSDPLVYLANLDLSTSGFDQAFQPVVGYNEGTAPGPVDWWMEFQISFMVTGTNTPLTVNDFNLSGVDIDGNGDKIREYVSFYGLTSYVLEANSLLQISDLTSVLNGLTSILGKRFDGPTLNFKNIDTSGTAVMVTTTYKNTNAFTIRVGGVASGSNGAAERMYSLYFKDFNYQSPTQITLPTKLVSFDATLKSSKAVLNWISLMEKDMSHYVVERSRDGHDFNDVTMIFANGSETQKASYSFTDNLSATSAGLVYYRLKMIDKDGRYEYSMVKIIRLTGKSGDMSVSVYPNPFASELRITIPTAWQDGPVNYDVFNVYGQMIKHMQNSRASQTETIAMGNIKAGIYTIRLTNGIDEASQRIVKSN